MKPRVASCLAVAAGVALEVGLAPSWHREAWDTAAYWSLGLPAAVIACGMLGHAAPAHARRYGPLLMAGQFLTMVVRGGLGPLSGVGLLLAAALSLPCTLAASLGADTARRAAEDDGPGPDVPD